MTVKLYMTTSSTSSRKMKEYLVANNIEHDTQITDHSPLEWEQLLEILMYTDNGIEDILAPRSKAYIDLIKNGMNFDELTLTEFHRLATKHPRLIKSPIIVAKSNTLIGYNEEELSMLKSKKERREMFNLILDRLDREPYEMAWS